MKKITPSEALSKMQSYVDRIKRLESDSYSDKRFKTQDLNKVRHDYKYIYLWHSIAVFNKNKERADKIIAECGKKHIIAHELLFQLDV